MLTVRVLEYRQIWLPGDPRHCGPAGEAAKGRTKMAVYRLGYQIHDPTDDTDGLYMAEIPVLPGCRAWAETPEAAINILQSVGQAFLAAYKDSGDELPAEVLQSAVTVEISSADEMPRILVPA